MSPVLTPTPLDPVAETLELSETELGRLFRGQQAGGWPMAGIEASPSNRMAKLATVAAICDLLRQPAQAGADPWHRPPAPPLPTAASRCSR